MTNLSQVTIKEVFMRDPYEDEMNELFQAVSDSGFYQLDGVFSAIMYYFMSEYFSGKISFDDIFLYQNKYQDRLSKMAYEAGRLE